MECKLCMKIVCNCEYRRLFLCTKFRHVGEIHKDEFWKLSVCEQIELLLQFIDVRKKDRARVRKEAYNISKPPACDILRIMDHRIWLLDKVRETIILNDTDQTAEFDPK